MRFFYSLIFLVVTMMTWGGQVHTNLTDLGSIHLKYSSPYHLELGYCVSGAGDFDGDGLLDIAIGAPAFNPEELENGYDNGCVFVVPGSLLTSGQSQIALDQSRSNIIQLIGPVRSRIGRSIARVGDVNADGIDDLALGSEAKKEGYIVFGRQNSAKQRFINELKEDGIVVRNTGVRVVSAGDLNADGSPDVAFTNPHAEKVSVEDQNYHVGNITVVLGGEEIPPVLDSFIPGNHLLTLRGEADALTGDAIVGGFDLNNDNYSDLAIVSPRGGKDFDGQAFVIYGKKDIDQESAPKRSFLMNHADGEIYSAGDVNKDGFSDLLLEGDHSTWYLLLGDDYQGQLDLHKFASNWGTTFLNAQSVYGVGDLNGDGFDDLAVAQPNATVDEKVLAGRVIFLFGRPQWPDTIDIQAISDGEFTVMDYVIVDGVKAFSSFGSSVAAIGDIQGNGYDDVLIGAPGERLPGDNQPGGAGDAYVIQGEKIFFSLQTRRSIFQSSAHFLPNNNSSP